MEKASKNNPGVNYLEVKMDKRIVQLIRKLQLNMPTNREILDDAESKLEIRFPDQYINFMLESNGLEGKIGNSSYLVIWPAEQIVILNEEYAVNEFTPGLVYFGSDGGGMAYAFDKRDGEMSVVEFPFESIDIKDTKLIGKTFIDFLQSLYDHIEMQ